MAINRKKTIKEMEAEWDNTMSKDRENTRRAGKTIKEMEAEWDSGSTQRNAGFAVGDFITIKDNLPGLAKSYTDKRYQLGGSATIQKSGIIPQYEQYSYYAPIISNDFAAGKDYLGLTDDEKAEYQAYMQQIAKDSVWGGKLASARTGGLDTIDMTGMPRAQKQELGRMDNLSQRDTVYEKLQHNPDQEYYEHNYGEIFQGMSEKEYLDELMAYMRTQKREEKSNAEAKKWADDAQAIESSAQGSSDYVQGKQYWRSLDRGLLNSGQNVFNVDGEELAYDEYMRRVEKSYINDYLGAIKNGDDDTIVELMEIGSAFPELDRKFSVDTLYKIDPAQVDTALKFVNNDDMEGLYKYLGMIDAGVAQKAVEEWNTNAAKWADKSVGNQILGTVASFPMNLVGGFSGAMDTASAVLEDKFGFKPIGGEYANTQANAGRVMLGMSDIFRGEMGQTIADATPFLDYGNGKNLANTAFQGIASLGDSLLSSATGPLQWVTMFGQEAGRTLYEQKDMGNDNASIYAVGVGAISAAMEKIGVDSLFKGSMKKAVLGNAGEEGLTEIANVIFDKIVNGNDSEFNRLADQYHVYGYGNKAEFKAALDIALNVGEATLGGMFAGLAGGAPDAIAARSEGKNIIKNEAQYDLADLAETVGVDGQAADIMRRLQAERADKTKGDKAEAEIAEKGGVTKEDAEAAAREAEMTERDKAERADETKETTWREWNTDVLENPYVPEYIAKKITPKERRQAQKTQERYEKKKEKRAADGKSVSEQDAASVTAEDVNAAKAKEQAKRDRKENADKKKGTKAVSKAEIGYLYRETMSKLDKEAQNIVSKNFSRDIRNELDLLGYDGDSKQASEAIAKFAMGEIAPETLDILENSKVARDIALSYVGKVDYRNSLYDRAYGIAQRASKDYVKPESTKAEKGTQEATKGVDDRAAISAEDVLNEDTEDIIEMTDDDIDVEIADADESTVNGRTVTIEGVASVADDGSIVYNVKDADGNTSMASAGVVTVGRNDSTVARLAEMAKDMGKNAGAMIKNYAEGQSVVQYAKAYKAAMQYGEDGRDLDTIKGYDNLRGLNEAQIEAAYDAGRETRTKRNTMFERKNAAGVKVGQVDTSAINMRALKANQAATVRSMTNIAKAIGFNVKFVESKANAEGRYTTENGRWDPKTLTLTLDVHAGSNSTTDTNYAMIHTAGHELTHYIKQFADGDMWNAYQEFVVGHLSKKDGAEFNLENEITSRMNAEGLTRDAAIVEVIADASGEALNRISEADIQSLAETNPGLMSKIKQFFKQWIGNLKKMISTAYKGTEAKNEVARQMMDAVDEMGKRWNALLVNAAKNRAENVVSETTNAKEDAWPKEYAQKFSARRPVEYTKNLVAVHNLTESKLQKALKLGGFPMPSIAITKADIGHSNFGNISLVFGSETVDPEFMRRNTVYSADAWTPTFPQIEYEVNEKAEKRIKDKYYALAKAHGYDFVRPMYTIANNLEEQINRYGGEEGLIDHLRDDTNMMQMYIAETNGEPVANITHDKVSRIEPAEAKRYEYFIGKLGRDVVLETEIKNNESPMMKRKEWLEKHGEELKKAYRSYLVDIAGIDEDTTNIVLSETKPAKLINEVIGARKYLKNGAETVSVEIDTDATNAAIRKAATGYEEWLNELIRGAVKDSGVYNNKELYTASGNRRSFKQTHYSVTLENIAKSMAGQNEGNSRNVSGFYGVKSLRAGTAKRFKSIAEMHELEGRLKKLTESEAQAINDALAERLDVLMNKIYNAKSHNQHGDMFLAMDAIGNMLMEAAELSNKSVENIKKVCADYHYKLNDSVVNEIRELLFDVEQMPVNIFEAKPERAIGFDEVRYAIVPDSLSDDALNALKNVVHDVRIYPDGDESARIELLNAREDLKFQKRDLSNLTDRDLLVSALETDLSEAERSHLSKYKEKVEQLNKDQRKLEELNTKIVELRNAGFTPRTSEELRAAETNVATLRGRIDRADAALNQIESAAMIKEVIRRNRKEASKQRAVQLREWQEKEKYKAMLERDTKRLYKFLLSPNKDKSVPEFLRKPVADFIAHIDFRSKRMLSGGEPTNRDIEFATVLENLRDAIDMLGDQQQNIDNDAEVFFGYIDLPTNYLQNFRDNVKEIKRSLEAGGKYSGTPIEKMSAAQIRELSQAMRILSSSITHIHDFLSEGRGTSAKNLADTTMNELAELKARTKTNKALELLNSTFNWKNTTPYYAFERLGLGGKAMFERLQNGWDKMAFNSAKVIEFSEKTFNAKESKAWSGEITEVTLDSGNTIRMTTAQKMSMYCHSKRAQSQGHLLGDGIRVGNIDGKLGTTIRQVDNYTLTLHDIKKITGSLTARQIEVADALQSFMSTVCADWGNEISMKRFGFKQMTEEFYIPIETDGNNRAKIDESREGGSSMFRLLNMSFLKPLKPKAKNAIVIKDIFDVFSDHASDMAKYNAMALPILDFIKWYNHIEKGDNGNVRSMQRTLESAFGDDARNYLTTFVKDLNAEHDGGRNDGLINSIIGRAKSAAVGANLRVYALQVTSLPRAAYAINPVYLAQGAAKLKNLNPVNAIKGTEAQDKVGILKWKDLGFYSTDISRSTRGMIKRNDGIMGKLRDWSMAPAGWGDNWVGSVIYEAVKAEMKAKHPEIKPGTATYDARVNERVREIVYKTQVVDSTMTRSDMMRSKGLASIVTAFMSEPTLTINMLNESIQKAVEIGRKGGNTREILRATSGMAVRAATTFAITSFVTGLLESAFDALRDDDEYETFEQKFADALGGNVLDNLNPITMLPILNEAWSILVEGYEDSSLITQVLSQGKSFMEAIKSYKDGKTTLYNVIYKGMQTGSSMAGVGVANATRDIASLYNTFLAPAWNTPKWQTYADTESTAAKAYYDAVTEGRTEDAEYFKKRMEVQGADMKKVNSKLVSMAGEGFLEGAASESDVREWLEDAGYSEDKAEDKMRDLNFMMETGVNYSEFKNAYLAGTIGKTEAQGLLKKYRGYDDNKVYFTLLEWEGGEGWSRYDAFLDAVDAQGNFAAEAKKLLDHGVNKSDIASAIASAYKDAYRQIHGTAEGNRLLEYLLDVYESIGYDRDYERKYITKNWIKD